MFFNNTDTQRMMLEQQLRLMREGVAMEDIAKTHTDQQKDGLDRFVEGVGRFAAGFTEGAIEGWREAMVKQKNQSFEQLGNNEIETFHFADDIPEPGETWHPLHKTYWGY